MLSCYECGANTNEVARRQVRTGHSRGHHGTRTYYSKRSLCPECAKWHDTKTTIKAILLIVFLLWCFVGSRNEERATPAKEQKSQQVREPGEAQKPPLSSAKKNH